jgi:pimeloyl-ACP methyl ester carboxylesterase
MKPTTRFALLALGLAAASGAQAREPISFPVSFETQDGFVLHGDLVSAGSTESPVAILLHMYRQDRSTWEPLLPALTARGITVLAIDQRTHGQSTRQGQKDVRVADLPRDAFGDVVRAGPNDVAAARAFLAKRGFRSDRLALVGASYGCSVALLSAGEVEGVRALVLLSPGEAYFAVPVTEAARGFTGPVLLVAAEDDANAAAAARALAASRTGPSQVEIFPSGGHGTRLFRPRPDLAGRIADFLAEAFGPPTPPKP